MFKHCNMQDEIFQSMKQNLASNQLEAKYDSLDKLSRATNYLNAASEIFEKSGMIHESIEIVNILHKIANQLGHK